MEISDISSLVAQRQEEEPEQKFKVSKVSKMIIGNDRDGYKKIVKVCKASSDPNEEDISQQVISKADPSELNDVQESLAIGLAIKKYILEQTKN